MKTKNNKKSLRQWIIQYNKFVLIGFIVTLLFYIFMNSYTMRQLSDAFDRYENVSEFYTDLDSANAHLKDYLNSDHKQAYELFQTDVHKAEENLKTLSKSDMQNGWRITLLQRMLTTYMDQADATKSAFDTNSDYEQEYTDLTRIYELTKNTSDTYYQVLTERMKYQNQRLQEMHYIIYTASIVFALLLIFWLLHFLSKATTNISEPLITMLSNIESIKQGPYDLTKISNTNQEMAALCEAMEEMADAIQNEIKTTKEKAELEKIILETENENLRKDELLAQSEINLAQSESKLAQSEVKMLQNQINPHFLFNTLNMIYHLALSEHAIKCSEMIEQTSALLRYGMDKQNKMSDLYSEIEAVKHYIAIQEKRLGDRVSFELQIDDPMINIIMPGMIIQPIIENSLKHGLHNCEGYGEIIITIQYHENTISIVISDNGVGMDSELCEQMMLNGFHDDTGEYLGMYNVVKRLEICYQERVNINIESETDCGFSFHIGIEVILDEELII